MKLRTLSAALAVVGLGFALPGQAAGISDDVIRIGMITDMSSVYSDIDGAGGGEAVRLAIEDAGGEINGKKIEFMIADHQNKADIASARAREWFDEENLDMLLGGTNSATALAMAAVAAEKKKPFIAIGPGSSNLTNSNCTPYTLHYAYDTIALARGTGSAIVEEGGKSWFFLTADYAFGHSLERDTSAVVKKAGGEVLGAVRVPLATSDFSSFLIQAQSSGAQILGLANAGGDFTASVKSAKEFGVTETMKLAGLLVFINDIHALGLDATQGMNLTSAWYWNQDDESRAWAKRFQEKVKRMPSFIQAADYSATNYYLKAVKDAGTDDGDEIMKWMKSHKVNDFFTKDALVREDGRVVNDMFLMEVKKPSESKGEWDYYNVVKKLPGEQVYASLEESTCEFIKK
ncbi:ABC transporter substrate-binding protein [Pollutimonas harenae]|uniref:ABC transporter substrate-binding protein n=1 Tax=Pollutimonas harenae TaxID=657015 RepID=A0A853H2Q1_9BURK|nr:ABC transporter substrate-binding protein [Pollutimonas harenae]NYT85505.1 ABC transporter substrate-binding protein [Pollutimonas harenae]TEA70592.1 ABC transporter substrate-binding protein [Pollutimonas harenae]